MPSCSYCALLAQSKDNEINCNPSAPCPELNPQKRAHLGDGCQEINTSTTRGCAYSKVRLLGECGRCQRMPAAGQRV